MKLYVMRHGPAEDESASGRDGDRALTPSGRDRVRLVAKALLDGGEDPFVIVSSPLVRALQTAEIVASVTSLDQKVEIKKAREGGATGAVEVQRGMAPGGDVTELIERLLREGKKRAMVVGHEPDLSTLVHGLTGTMPPEGMLKAMVVGLKLVPNEAEGRGYTASLRFVLDPKTLEWRR